MSTTKFQDQNLANNAGDHPAEGPMQSREIEPSRPTRVRPNGQTLDLSNEMEVIARVLDAVATKAPPDSALAEPTVPSLLEEPDSNENAKTLRLTFSSAFKQKHGLTDEAPRPTTDPVLAKSGPGSSDDIDVDTMQVTSAELLDDASATPEASPIGIVEKPSAVALAPEDAQLDSYTIPDSHPLFGPVRVEGDQFTTDSTADSLPDAIEAFAIRAAQAAMGRPVALRHRRLRNPASHYQLRATVVPVDAHGCDVHVVVTKVGPERTGAFEFEVRRPLAPQGMPLARLESTWQGLAARWRARVRRVLNLFRRMGLGGNA